MHCVIILFVTGLNLLGLDFLVFTPTRAQGWLYNLLAYIHGHYKHQVAAYLNYTMNFLLLWIRMKRYDVFLLLLLLLLFVCLWISFSSYRVVSCGQVTLPSDRLWLWDLTHTHSWVHRRSFLFLNPSSEINSAVNLGSSAHVWGVSRVYGSSSGWIINNMVWMCCCS